MEMLILIILKGLCIGLAIAGISMFGISFGITVKQKKKESQNVVADNIPETPEFTYILVPEPRMINCDEIMGERAVHDGWSELGAGKHWICERKEIS